MDWSETVLGVCGLDGTIFAPKDFQEHKSLAIHTGVVPFKEISDHFRAINETNHMEIELLLQFMIHMEVCREINDPRGGSRIDCKGGAKFQRFKGSYYN